MAPKAKLALLLLCMVAFSQHQVVSLTDFIKNQGNGNLKKEGDLPDNCKKIDADGICTQC